MPRASAEAERRQALIDAAIAMIGESGSLEIPVKRIALRAGMSSALAFHYFGDKDSIVVETMRYLLRSFACVVVDGLREVDTPLRRAEAVIDASFSPEQFEQNTVAAWLVFYLHAYSSPQSRRLLEIYQARLQSNLVDALLPVCGRRRSREIATGLGALIDGLYIREALSRNRSGGHKAREICREYLLSMLNEPSSEATNRSLVHGTE